jgi:hypothetical protein
VIFKGLVVFFWEGFLFDIKNSGEIAGLGAGEARGAVE